MTDTNGDPLHTTVRIPTTNSTTGAPRGARLIVMVMCVLIVGATAVWYWYQSQPTTEVSIPAQSDEFSEVHDQPAPESHDLKPGVQPATVADTPESTPPPAAPLPDLLHSDDFIRAEIADWSLPDQILGQDGLISRLTAVVANAADGSLPTRLLKPFAPKQAYAVNVVGDQTYVAPESFARYDAYLDTLEQITPASAAMLLNRITPLMRAALAELGDSREPAELIHGAIRRLEALPELPERIALVPAEANYEYADKELAALPEFDKQLLRLGPDNIARLRVWAADFERAYP